MIQQIFLIFAPSRSRDAEPLQRYFDRRMRLSSFLKVEHTGESEADNRRFNVDAVA